MIRKGVIIYRAAATLEVFPTPRFCDETEKTGVYFSVVTPYLSESMPIEKRHGLVLASYVLTDDIYVHNDKYYLAKEGLARLFSPSHLDCGIFAQHEFEERIAVRGAELFLNARDLRHIRFLGCRWIGVTRQQLRDYDHFQNTPMGQD
jgi:hypothetical protein